MRVRARFFITFPPQVSGITWVDPPCKPGALASMPRLVPPILLALSLSSLGCAPGSSSVPGEADSSESERSVRAAVDDFADSERRRDVDAILGFLAPDFYMYADGTRVDYETAAEQIRTTMPSLQRLETTWSDVEVTVLGQKHALVTLVFRDVMTDKKGATTRLRGPTTFVWRLDEGAWRIIYADAVHYPDAP